MTSNELKVNILAPGKTVATVRAKHVQLPGSLGYMGILPGHASLVAELGIGEVKVEGDQLNTPDKVMYFFIAGGYVEVYEDEVTILADVVEKPEEMDIERAKKAQERAHKRLSKENDTENLDIERARLALLRALARENFVNSHIKHSSTKKH